MSKEKSGEETVEGVGKQTGIPSRREGRRRRCRGANEARYFEEHIEPSAARQSTEYSRSHDCHEEIQSGEEGTTWRPRQNFPRDCQLSNSQLASRPAQAEGDQHPSFEILMKEGRNKLYVAVEDKAAVQHLTKVIIFDVPTYIDADQLDPSPNLVWVRRRMVGDEARPQMIGVMEGDIPQTGTIYINGLGYKRVARYLPQSMFCERCHEEDHASMNCSGALGCNFYGIQHNSPACWGGPVNWQEARERSGYEGGQFEQNSHGGDQFAGEQNGYGNDPFAGERNSYVGNQNSSRQLPLINPEPSSCQDPQYNFPLAASPEMARVPSLGGTAAELEQCLAKLTVMAEEGNQRLENLKRQLQRMEWNLDDVDEQDETDHWKEDDYQDDDEELDDHGEWIEVRMRRFEENLSRNIDDLLHVLLQNSPRKTEMKETGG